MSGWNTIESDTGVFTELVENLGTKGCEFEELLSIDQESLQAISPIYGVVLLFKYRRSENAKASQTNEPPSGKYDRSVELNDLFFSHQVVQNACATQAVLSILLNADDLIDIGPELEEFKLFTSSFDPSLKGECLTNSELLRTVHNSFSRPSPFYLENDDDKPDDEENDGLYHYISYVAKNGQLYELDGLHPFPISHGPCTKEDFAAKLSKVLQERISRGPSGEMRFNLMALTKDWAAESTDPEVVAARNEKRQRWARENALRRENFVGLINTLVRGIASTKSDQQWKDLILKGREKSKQRLRANKNL